MSHPGLAARPQCQNPPPKCEVCGRFIGEADIVAGKAGMHEIVEMDLHGNLKESWPMYCKDCQP